MRNPKLVAPVIVALSLLLSPACAGFAADGGRPPAEYFDLLVQIRVAEQKRQWGDAANLTRRLMRDYSAVDYGSARSHQGELADYLYYQNDLTGAEKEYARLVTATDLDLTAVGAAYGLARISADRGLWDGAAEWLAVYRDAFGNGCGNAIEWRRQNAHMLAAVWKAAARPPKEAEPALRAIIAGGFQPLPDEANLGSEKRCRERARDEARLRLADLYLKAGRVAEAKTLLAEAAKGRTQPGDVAAARLSALGPAD